MGAIRLGAAGAALLAASVGWTPLASAATLSVGPGAKYTKIADAVADAKPGDVVEVQGDATYAGTILLKNGGTPGNPITVRGIPVNGKRPVLKGIGPGKWDNMVVLLNGNHFVFESFEVVGAGNSTDYCIVHKADDVLLRDLVVHNCLHQGGLVSTDDESGSLTLEYSEFYHNGGGETSHQLYMATDSVTYPKSVFRMQYCYVHDGLGGNNVKSRAERNEIYSNWIEGAFYHELDLIGPDTGDAHPRDDSDVVGNVLVKTSQWRIARIGGDGSGNASGRYRFVNNTMILADSTTTAIGLQQTVSTVEMYNNVIYGAKPGFKIYDVNEPVGPAAVFFGGNNWVLDGAKQIPASWTGTITGSDPGWVDPAMHDLRPTASSPLVGKGTTATATTGDLAFPSPLALPAYYPPQRRLIEVGKAEARPKSAMPAIGAFETAATAPGAPLPDPVPESGGAGGTGAGAGGAGGDAAADDASSDDGGSCGCTTVGRGASGAAWVALGLAGLVGLARRRRQSR